MFSFLPASLQNPFFIAEIVIPVILILLDIVTGIASAMKEGTFNGKMVADFLGHGVLHYLVTVVVVWIIYSLSGSAAATLAANTFGMGALGIATASSIYQNCREMLTPAEMALVDMAGSALGYPDPGASGPLPPANPTTPPLHPVPTPQGAFVDQRPIGSPPIISLPPSNT